MLNVAVAYLPRFRVRTLLNLVANSALFLFLATSVYRVTDADANARRHESLHELFEDEAIAMDSRNGIPLGDFPDPTKVYNFRNAVYLRRSHYHAALSRKWRGAANRPWLPFEPDPPVPEIPGCEVYMDGDIIGLNIK
jgi:hypothetical protein